MTDGPTPTNSYLGGYLATLGGMSGDETLLVAADRLDPELAGYHREVFEAMGKSRD